MKLTLYYNFSKTAYFNPFSTLYVQAFAKQLTYSAATCNLALIRFDLEGNYLDMPQSEYQISTFIYYSETRAIAFADNRDPRTNGSQKFIVQYCPMDFKYDEQLQKCITSEECIARGRKVLGSMCLKTCIDVYSA